MQLPRCPEISRSHLVVPAVLSLGLSGAVAHGQTNEDLKLNAQDGEPGDKFGSSVALSGTTALIGSPLDGDNGLYSGAAYLFDVTTGQQLTKLSPSDGAEDQRFGITVALSGQMALVGAFGDADNGPLSGAAYVFDATSGQELFKLTASDGAQDDWFGRAVAISGQMVVIGADQDDDDGSRSGSAYVFDISTGQELFKLTASDGEANDLFGCSVAISGDLALVGSLGDDDNGSASGSAYLFDITTGTELLKLTAPDGSKGDEFGQAVAIRGDVAVVGAWGKNVVGSNSGTAYVFDVTTGQQTLTLTPNDAAGGDWFGRSVAIGEDEVVIGSFHHDTYGYSDAGTAYVFDLTTGKQTRKLAASDASLSDWLGRSVGISGGLALVGASLDDDLGASSGSAYLFDLNPDCATRYCDASQNPNNAAVIDIDTCDSAAPSIQVCLAGAPANQFVYLLVGDGSGTVSQPPGAKGDLCVVGGSCLGRYDKDVGQITSAGTFTTDIQNALSNPCAGAVAIAPGATWNFQYWHRQPMGQPATFSDAISVTFE